MNNQIKRYNPYTIVAIGLISLVASTIGVNLVLHTVFKKQDLTTTEAVDELLKTPQWYYIENSTATVHQQVSC